MWHRFDYLVVLIISWSKIQSLSLKTFIQQSKSNKKVSYLCPVPGNSEWHVRCWSALETLVLSNRRGILPAFRANESTPRSSFSPAPTESWALLHVMRLSSNSTHAWNHPAVPGWGAVEGLVLSHKASLLGPFHWGMEFVLPKLDKGFPGGSGGRVSPAMADLGSILGSDIPWKVELSTYPVFLPGYGFHSLSIWEPSVRDLAIEPETLYHCLPEPLTG